jgi:mRNA interferase MazF
MPGKCARGDVLTVNLDPTLGTEISKTRPCAVVQNNIGNRFSNRTIIVPITDKEHVPKDFPVHVRIPKGEGGVEKDSVILCDQIRSIDEKRIVSTYGKLSASTMKKVDKALRISLALHDPGWDE